MPRVFVVGYDPMVCRTIEACLQRQGFDVTGADGDEAGIRALESPAFDVMLVGSYALAGVDNNPPDFLRMPLELGAMGLPAQVHVKCAARGRQ